MDLAIYITTDQELFASLSKGARNTVKRRLRAMRKIASAKTIAAGCRAVMAELGGFSDKRLYTLYSEFEKSGHDWKVLINRAQAGPRFYKTLKPIDRVPDAFIDHLASEWSMRQRDKFKAVHHSIVQQWRAWRRCSEADKIPGYELCPEPDPLTGLPPGWSYDNLHRLAKTRLSRFSRKLVQVGPKTAYLAEAPHILTTRGPTASNPNGVEVSEYIFPDDSWNDFKVLAFGQTIRLLSFHLLDYASGHNCKRGYKPAIEDERGIEQRLKEREMIWLTVAHLTNNGYRARGTTFLCEKATATIREQEEAIFHDFGLPIFVQRGPRGGGPGIDALFTGPGGGNPRWKAPLESWFNLLRNRTDHLLEFPGQTGSFSSGLPVPEGLPGLERDTKALIEAARALPLERAELMQIGMLNYTDAIFALEKVTELMNWRDDHELEGWRKCNRFVTEWRPHVLAPWLPAAELVSDKYSPAERQAFSALTAANPALKRERPLSPAEVYYSARLTKLPMHIAAVLMAQIDPSRDGDGAVSETTVVRGLLEVHARELDPDEPMRYGLTRRDGNGTDTPLRTGEKFLVRLNHCDPSVAWLYHANGSFAGVANFYARSSRNEQSRDHEGAGLPADRSAQSLHQQYATKRQWLAEQTADARFFASRLTKADIARTENNNRVLDTKTPLTAEEKATAAFIKTEGQRAAEDFLNSPATT